MIADSAVSVKKDGNGVDAVIISTLLTTFRVSLWMPVKKAETSERK